MLWLVVGSHDLWECIFLIDSFYFSFVVVNLSKVKIEFASRNFAWVAYDWLDIICWMTSKSGEGYDEFFVVSCLV